MKPKDSAYFFEPIQCCECQSKENLMMHKYSDQIKCSGCVQDKHTEPSVDIIWTGAGFKAVPRSNGDEK